MTPENRKRNVADELTRAEQATKETVIEDGATTVMVLRALRDIAAQAKAVHGEHQRLNQRLHDLEARTTDASRSVTYARPRLVPPPQPPHP